MFNKMKGLDQTSEINVCKLWLNTDIAYSIRMNNTQTMGGTF